MQLLDIILKAILFSVLPLFNLLFKRRTLTSHAVLLCCLFTDLQIKTVNILYCNITETASDKISQWMRLKQLLLVLLPGKIFPKNFSRFPHMIIFFVCLFFFLYYNNILLSSIPMIKNQFVQQYQFNFNEKLWSCRIILHSSMLYRKYHESWKESSIRMLGAIALNHTVPNTLGVSELAN
jgi:hypothetical protein